MIYAPISNVSTQRVAADNNGQIIIFQLDARYRPMPMPCHIIPYFCATPYQPYHTMTHHLYPLTSCDNITYLTTPYHNIPYHNMRYHAYVPQIMPQHTYLCMPDPPNHVKQHNTLESLTLSHYVRPYHTMPFTSSHTYSPWPASP